MGKVKAIREIWEEAKIKYQSPMGKVKGKMFGYGLYYAPKYQSPMGKVKRW